MYNYIAIIGSDSFIASKFYNSNEELESIRLYTRQESGKPNEIIKDLFEITSEDFVGADVVINFAAIVHQPKLNNETIYKRVNKELSIHLAKESKKAGVKHFIQMSTIAVYGNVTSIDVNSKENPSNMYGVSKLAADKALLAMQDVNFKATIIRPPMVYGGGKAPGNLQNLIKATEKGIPMPFKGVNNKRDFIHVSNLVEAIKIVIENKINGVVIPTDKQPVSTEQIIYLINKYSDKKVWQVKLPLVVHNMIKVLKPKIYMKVFGDLQVNCNLPEDLYKPSFVIEDGIKEMVESM